MNVMDAQNPAEVCGVFVDGLLTRIERLYTAVGRVGNDLSNELGPIEITWTAGQLDAYTGELDALIRSVSATHARLFAINKRARGNIAKSNKRDSGLRRVPAFDASKQFPDCSKGERHAQ